MIWLDGDMFAQQKPRVAEMEDVEDVQAQDSDKSNDEMEIYNLVHTKNIEEREGLQTLIRHWKSSRCPKLDRKPMVILHLTQPHQLLRRFCRLNVDKAKEFQPK